ncbi:DNA-processing protein DprA [Chitinophaga sp. Cy-1792]|uniref:DNA-processing protein DprA n=1 Tax=Chitinophaga sp. Cy-1792 TaxID=2608339 RepID=UPI001420A04E|nr:DNA-processing protein DprA [Chitinophaga sp. Cy-1792]NIG53242.1 DNA-protecting protein DprA [Chitinophaga sp. Cy-1792]
MPDELMYRIALTQVPMLGDVSIRKLLEHFDSAAAIFRARSWQLEKTAHIGSIKANAIRKFSDFTSIEKEISFLSDYDIQPLWIQDSSYPGRLKHCYDAPAMLYYKGKADLNGHRMVNVIGTRQPSPYGVQVCGQIVNDLCAAGVIIVSGLAYGIDIIAHRAALAAEQPTVGVLAHGLDRIYPSVHQDTAREMALKGGLLTDYRCGTLPDRQNFPRRNRIVAGLCDATIVIESGIKGGSLITAELANGYNRDVFCVPGRINEWHAAGCNSLIQQNKAMLATAASDILDTMGWNKPVNKGIRSLQPSLFTSLSAEEQQIMALFEGKSRLHLEELYIHSKLSGSQVATAVFNLEMQCLIKCLPGQLYEPVS